AATIVATLRDGTPVLGSDHDGVLRLAEPRGFVRDMRASVGDFWQDLGISPSFDEPFTATPGSVEFKAQDIYYKVLSLLDLVGTRIHRRWDSLLGENSSFLPGTFEPRIVMTVGRQTC